MHVISSIAPRSGGTTWAVLDLANAQAHAGAQVMLLTGEVPGEQQSTDALIAELVDAPVAIERITERGRFGCKVARGIAQRLSQIADEYDVFHVHGMWSPSSLRAASWAVRHGKPYLYAPHGMLEPWPLQQKAAKKRLALNLIYRRYLKQASVIHATAEQEIHNLRQLGLTRPIALIPNGVRVPQINTDARELIENHWPVLHGRKRLLFMSRIHPKKGLVHLVNCWRQLCETFVDWHLVIAGPDQQGHRAEIENMIARFGLSKSVTFTGSVLGTMKQNLLAGCDLFVLPTYSENFGIVIAEALAAQTPVITTRGTPWEQLQTHDCGWWIEIGEGPLLAALQQAMATNDEQRLAMGERGRQLVIEQYTWQAIAQSTLDIYQWACYGGPRPAAVTV